MEAALTSASLRSAHGRQLVILQWSSPAARAAIVEVTWLARGGENRPPPLAPAPAACVSVPKDGSELFVVWEAKDRPASTFSAAWLQCFLPPSSVHTSLSKQQFSAAPANAMSASASAAPLGREALPCFTYSELTSGPPASIDAVTLRWLTALEEGGLTLITGAGTQLGAAQTLATRAFGGPLLSLYGPSPDVPNVALRLSSPPPPVEEDGSDGPTALPLHVDLCSYEGTPGLHMLHCRRFDEQIQGGWSTFIDGVFAAEQLRRESPDAFVALATLPMTFQTIKHQRNGGGLPAHYVCRRPCIAVEPSLRTGDRAGSVLAGRVMGVFWSRGSEGPLLFPDEDAPGSMAERLLGACATFSSLLARLHSGRGTGGGRLVTFRLAEGEIAVFNNRRMLHGRRAFYTTASDEEAMGARRVQTSPPEGVMIPAAGGADAAPPRLRTLQGCYVSVDEWRSRLAGLRAMQAPAPGQE